MDTEQTPSAAALNPSHDRCEDVLTTGVLSDIASGLARAHALWALPAAAPTDSGIVRRRILATSGYDVWLHAWAPGAAAKAHDHAGSVSVVRVIDGVLAQQVALTSGADLVHLLWAGSVTELDALSAHSLRNPFPAPALSIHVYSPSIGADSIGAD